jgi:iron-sulfur cluster repair protein YtfE (RIC family)
LIWIIQRRLDPAYSVGKKTNQVLPDRKEIPMNSLTQPLRDEHQELFPHIEALRTTADLIGQGSPGELIPAVDQAYEFLAHHLLPHAIAEDQALYPAVAEVLGAPESTDTMRRDHVEVAALIEELGQLRPTLQGDRLTPEQSRALRKVLYGLYTLVRVHFLKEEEVYLPILDARLTPERAREMFAAMEAAAQSARQTV